MFEFVRTIVRYRAVAKAALEEEETQGKKPKLRRNEREFQAAAIEIMETPPSPLGRTIGLLIISLFVVALIWSIIGRLDIYATLQGKIIPVGKIKVIEPLITGKVKAIYVRQGQRVDAGELLLELDPTQHQADRVRIEEDLMISQAISTRLKTATKLIMENTPAKMAQLPSMPKAPPSVIKLQQNLLTRTLMAYEAEQASIVGEIKQKSMELKRTKNTVAERHNLVEVMTERVTMLDKLVKSGSGTRAAYLERAQVLYEQRADLATEQGRLAELESAIETLKLQAKQRREELLRKLTSELADNEKRIAGLRQEVVKATTQEKQSRLYAPVSGAVQQLAVHTVGDVLTTGQQAMVIVPIGTKLEVEALLLNKDKGFVKEKQIARIKVETFNFTKYGIIPGKVIAVSNDAISPAQPQSQLAQSVGGASSSGPLVFPVRIALERETLFVNGEHVRLSPGMSVSAEVKTGDRRVIEFLLSPLLRMKDEAARER